MADKRWKRVEREKCRALGSERSGPTGRDTPDCVGLCVGLEVKSYKKFVFLTEDWKQAKENAAKLDQPPVLAVKETGQNGRDVVQMHEATWLFFEIAGRTSGAPLNVRYHCVDGDKVVRMPWSYFAALYGAAYPTDQEA